MRNEHWWSSYHTAFDGVSASYVGIDGPAWLQGRRDREAGYTPLPNPFRPMMRIEMRCGQCGAWVPVGVGDMAGEAKQ